MPYQSDQLLRMCARPKIAVPASIEPARGWISPGRDHDRRDDDKIEQRAEQQARRHADAHQAAGADHREIERGSECELADVHAGKLRQRSNAALDQRVVPAVELDRQVPRGGQAEPLLLDELHVAFAGDEAREAGDGGRDGQCLGAEHAPCGPGTVVQRVEDDAAGATFREGMLLVVDEATLHRERHQHAEARQQDVEHHDLPYRQDLVGRPHVRRQARGQRHRHVAGRSRDRLHAVVFEDRHVARAELREDAVDRKREDDRSQADTERPAGLGAHVEVGDAQQSTEQEPGDGRTQRELRHVAAVDVGEPPAVFLFEGPGADLFGGQLLQGHRRFATLEGGPRSIPEPGVQAPSVRAAHQAAAMPASAPSPGQPLGAWLRNLRQATEPPACRRARDEAGEVRQHVGVFAAHAREAEQEHTGDQRRPAVGPAFARIGTASPRVGREQAEQREDHGRCAGRDVAGRLHRRIERIGDGCRGDGAAEGDSRA